MNITEYWLQATKDHEYLSGSACAVLSVLHFNKPRPWKQSQGKLAEYLGLDSKAVFRAIKKLESLGFVEKQYPENRHNKRVPWIALVKEANV